MQSRDNHIGVAGIAAAHNVMRGEMSALSALICRRLLYDPYCNGKRNM